jgi:hypothetical protein
MLWLSRFALISLSIIAVGCSPSSDSGGNFQKTFDPGCVSTISYSGGITLSGDAVYQYRNNGNGIVNPLPNPIRQAQVTVYDASNAIVQCGSTDDNGDFAVTVPSTTANYTIAVSARIYDSVTKAAVFNNPTENSVHFISTTASGVATANVGTLVASATGDIKGGAFNILDQIYEANLYLLSSTANCTTTFSACTPFTGAPPVFIYWDAGVNPGEYFNAGALSFYLPGESELYILGGENGDTDSSDVDHFDNSIVLHEYGHFIEDIFSDTDSPGGSHSGNSIIDPRLAWGEGWANFFQAAVLNNPVYRDTYGNVSGGTTGTYFNENLETPGKDIPIRNGEGNFREFSITRLLWDAIDSVNENPSVDNVSGQFMELWTLFTSSNVGLKNPSHVFRNMGLFHSLQQSLGASNWSVLRSAEKHASGQENYARSVGPGSCASINIRAESVPYYSGPVPYVDPDNNASITYPFPENGTSSRSNQFASNDFYRYYHPGGSFLFQLSYTTTASTAADLDVYILRNAYRFTDTSSTSIAASANNSVVASATSGSESISTSLPAGWYMINIRVDSSNGLGNAANYTMTLNGAQLCPN